MRSQGCVGRTIRCGVLMALALGVLLTSVSTASAQVSTGGIRGIVRDESGGVLIGVTVEASSPARIGGAAVQVTNEQGLYRLDNLAIGVYKVSFSLQGFRGLVREGIRVELGRTVELGATLAVGGLAESVTVTGEAPVVDVAHAGYSTNFNEAMLESLVTTRTSWFDSVTVAPAVRSDPVSANSATFLLYGSSSDQNSYQNDGVEVAAPSGGTVWSFPNPDSIQEQQVIGVGASAEYAGFQGGVVNIVTKSGSNRFRGTMSYYFVGGKLVGNNSPDEEFPYSIQYNSDAGFSLGGPIKTDRLWVLGMMQFTNVQSSDIGVDPATAPKNHNYKPFVKVTAKPSAVDNINFQYSDEYFSLPESPDILNPTNTIRNEHGTNPIFIANWTRTIGAATLLEVKGGGIYIRDKFDPNSGDFTTPGHYDSDTGMTSVNTTSLINWNTQNQTTVAATLARNINNFLGGSHDLKFGGSYSNGMNLQNQTYPGGVWYEDVSGEPYQATYTETSATIGRVRSTGLFVQDTWAVSGRATASLGVRYDNFIGDIPSTDQLDPTMTKSIGTYPGISDVVKYNNVSPRLGISIKLDTEGKTVAKASFGRYYARLNTGLFQAISPGGIVRNTYDYNPATGKYDILFNTSNPKQNQTVDPNLSNQWSDQFFVGIERQIAGDFGLNVSYIKKQEKNFIRGLDIGSQFAPYPYYDAFGDQTLTLNNRSTPSSQVLVEPTNRSDFRQKYDTVVVQASKRMSHNWQLQASYQWEKSEGFSTGTSFSGQSGPSTFGADPNQLVNAYGRFPSDSTHSIRMSASITLPFGLTFSAREIYESGRPYGRVITVRGLSQGTATIIAQPRGTFELPARNDFGIRIGKNLDLGAGREVRLSADISNLFNSDTPLTVDNNSSHAATYGDTTGIFLPRRALLGIRFMF